MASSITLVHVSSVLADVVRDIGVGVDDWRTSSRDEAGLGKLVLDQLDCGPHDIKFRTPIGILP
jgi:hypothetical protein